MEQLRRTERSSAQRTAVGVRAVNETAHNGAAAPHSDEAEYGVLGSMLLSREATDRCVQEISPEYFYSPAHQTICNLLIELRKADKPIDLILVTQELRDKKLLDSVGGPAHLTHLCTFVPSPANVDYYVEILKTKWRARKLLSAAKETIRLLSDEHIDVAEIVKSARQQLESIESSDACTQELSVRYPEEILALPLDEETCFLGDRLFAKEQSLVIAGTGGIGKTRLLLQLLVALIVNRPWCGIETHGHDLTCLLIQTENSNRRLRDDLRFLKEWAGADWPLVQKKLLIHTLENEWDCLLSLADQAAVGRLKTVIRKLNPSIIAVDPLRDLASGDLNSDADMGATLRILGEVIRTGNPQRGLIVLHHALTGRAGVAKAFGLDRTGFARNSKVLQTWSRAMINVVPGSEENNETLVLTCGKNSNGKEFAPVAVRLNPDTMIYEVDEEFDVQSWRRQVCNVSKRRTYSPEIVRDLIERGRQFKKKDLVKVIQDDTGCGKSCAYELVEEATNKGILDLDKESRMYFKPQ
jgi:hypothetical protein